MIASIALPCEQAIQDGVSLAWIFTDGPGEADAIGAILSAEEQARAAAHRHHRDRASYRAAHALKRTMLADCLDRAPETLAFETGPFGKPFLRDHDRLQFSLSHCDGLAILAWGLGRPVGIDAERLTGAPFDAGMAEIAFHAEEHAALAVLPEDERHEAQMSLWVLREAYAKGTGLGLLHQPADLAFALHPPRILHGIQPNERWNLSLRRVGAGHLVGLAIAA